MTDRVTNSMTSRTVMSDIQNVYSELVEDPAEAVVGQADHEALGRSVRDEPRAALPRRPGGEPAVPGQRRRRDLLARRDRHRAQPDGQRRGPRARARAAGRERHALRSSSAARSPRSSTRSPRASSRRPTRSTPAATSSRARRRRRRRSRLGGADTYLGNSDSISREIGQNVQVPVNVTGRHGRDAAARRDPAGRGRSARRRHARESLDDRHHRAGQRLRRDPHHAGERRARARTGLTAATDRLQQLEQAQTQQLSDVEDADIAQTMIDYSTQSAVYQAALKSGANLIQPSLMNFLN